MNDLIGIFILGFGIGIVVGALIMIYIDRRWEKCLEGFVTVKKPGYAMPKVKNQIQIDEYQTFEEMLEERKEQTPDQEPDIPRRGGTHRELQIPVTARIQIGNKFYKVTDGETVEVKCALMSCDNPAVGSRAITGFRCREHWEDG